MKNKVNMKVDQFNLVYVFRSTNISPEAHNDECLAIISEVVTQLDFEKYYGEIIQGSAYNGYDVVYNYGDYGSQYLKIAYSSTNRAMGISFDFKAKGLEKYLSEASEHKKDNYQFYHLVQDFIHFFSDPSLEEVGILKLGRHDFAIDFIDWGIKLDDYYEKLKTERYSLHRVDGRVKQADGSYGYRKIDLQLDSLNPKLSHIGKKEIETIYVGRRGEELFLRIYNKYLESYSKASLTPDSESLTDWIRYEVEMKHSKVQSLNKIEEIKKIKDNHDYFIWIANNVLNYMRLKTDKGRDTKIMRALEEIANGNRNASVLIEKRTDKSIFQRMNYFLHGNSGLPQLLKDIEIELGVDAVDDFLLQLAKPYNIMTLKLK